MRTTAKPIEDESDRRKGFRFIPTMSWDSVAVIVGLALSGFLYVQTIKTDQAILAGTVQQQAKDVANVQKSVERLEADSKERINRVEVQQKERADRIEQIVKEQNKMVQEALDRLRK